MMPKVFLLLIFLLICFLCSCSPTYVIRAGYEEARILLGRKDITKLLESEDIEQPLKDKLVLVSEARNFAKSLGLTPKGSFTSYSEINRDILVWVLSASKKTQLEGVTWWYPIVGKVPYQGYFAKESADASAKKLSKKYDVYLRPSAAFSTLGWFEDPLLSTMIRFDDISLVNTVIHEIVHNTFWVKDHVPFNETMANIVASIATIEFYRQTCGADCSITKEAEEILSDELVYATFLENLILELEAFYRHYADNFRNADERKGLMVLRERIFLDAAANWKEMQAAGLVKSKYYKNRQIGLNNAFVLAEQVYLKEPRLFLELFAHCGNSPTRLIASLAYIADNHDTGDPYNLLRQADCRESNP